jgi:hypothetical protein
VQTSRLCRGPRRRATRRAAHSSTAGRRVPSLDRTDRVSPRVRREIDIATTTQTLESRCLRDQRPDCQRRIEGRRRILPGASPGPDPPGPHLAAGQGARQLGAAPPRVQRGRKLFATHPQPDGGEGRSQSLAERNERSGSAREAREPRGGDGGGPPGGRDGADVDLARRTRPRGVRSAGGGSRCWSLP